MMAATMAACSNSDDELSVGDGSPVAITFAISGDFTLTSHDFTRSLTADGKDMTDVWVLDYVDGTLVQQLHQSDNTAADFGTPTLNLSIGTHHIYFIASRGFAATLNTDEHTLTFGAVRDTFWKDYAVTITSGTASSSRSVTLDRVVTKLKVVFSDAIPAGATTFNITPATWYYGINYTTGEPISATPSQPITVNIPPSEIGVVNEAVSIFGFSSATEWTTNIVINCKSANNDLLGSATITSAPFARNRVSEYTGQLFGDNGGMTLSLNATWDDSYTGTW
jgi:hypothetical protein